MGLDPSAPAPKKKIPSIVGVRSDVATPAPILLRQALEGRTLSLRGTRQPRAIRPATPVSKKPESRRARMTGPCKSTSASKPAVIPSKPAVIPSKPAVIPSKPAASASKPAASSSNPAASRTASGTISARAVAAMATPLASDSGANDVITSAPVPCKPIKHGPSMSAPAELPSRRSVDPSREAPAFAAASTNLHNDSTLRVMPLPAPSHAAQRVRVLPIAPRSSRAPLIAIACLLVAGLAIGVYFALPYVIDWYKSESAPLQIDEVHAPKSVAQQSAAGDAVAAPSSAGTTPKAKKAKGAKATKKKVGAAKKPRKQR